MTKSGSTPSENPDSVLELEALDSAPGPARPLSAAEAAALIDRLERQLSGVRPRGKRFRLGAVLGVAGALAAASAAAAIYVLRPSEPLATTAPIEAGRSAGVPTKPPAPAPGGAPQVAPGTADEPTDTPAPGTTSPGAPAAEPGAVQAESARPNVLTRHSKAAADRLAEANALRGRHRYRQALDLYLRVIDRYPSSMQASAARVAAAAMRLEQFGDVQGAERLYREAKTTGGELTAEAEFGLAEVFRARHDRSAELQALHEFTVRYPDNPLTSVAERRLQVLEGR